MRYSRDISAITMLEMIEKLFFDLEDSLCEIKKARKIVKIGKLREEAGEN